MDGTQIHVFDKFDRRSFVTNVRNVASERYFHEVSEDHIAKLLEHVQKHATDFGNPDELAQLADAIKGLGDIEHRLSLLEKQLDKMLDTVMSEVETCAQWLAIPPVITSLKTATPQDRSRLVDRMIQAKPVDPAFKPDIAFLVAIQLVRTKEHRTATTEFLETSSTAISEMILRMMGVDVSEYEIQSTINPETEQLLHLGQMLDPDYIFGIADTLMKHIWMFEANNTPQLFFTSDNPVAIVPNKFSPNWHYTGIASEGIEIRMPLSPRYAVTFYERTHFNEMRNLEGKVLPLVEDNVIRHNSIQINQSNRQIYSQSSDFELAERTCREHPEVCDPNRPRFDIRSG